MLTFFITSFMPNYTSIHILHSSLLTPNVTIQAQHFSKILYSLTRDIINIINCFSIVINISDHRLADGVRSFATLGTVAGEVVEFAVFAHYCLKTNKEMLAYIQ